MCVCVPSARGTKGCSPNLSHYTVSSAGISLLVGFLEGQSWSWCWWADTVVTIVYCSLQTWGTEDRTWLPKQWSPCLCSSFPHFHIPFAPFLCCEQHGLPFLLLVLSSSPSFLLHTTKILNLFSFLGHGPKFGLKVGQARFLTGWRQWRTRWTFLVQMIRWALQLAWEL